MHSFYASDSQNIILMFCCCPDLRSWRCGKSRYWLLATLSSTVVYKSTTNRAEREALTSGELILTCTKSSVVDRLICWTRGLLLDDSIEKLDKDKAEPTDCNVEGLKCNRSQLFARTILTDGHSVFEVDTQVLKLTLAIEKLSVEPFRGLSVVSPLAICELDHAQQ